ncbi:hypothetical protein [Paraferrimonas haliotis]|uniref:Uncharacterized protein n=1 Tax=Paraferrimonas haliotis TaxID=2013866 RepID=A0AA37TTY8_9GAMM|nr:hypothetical protein [Paraferrimonas haliotis]GLS82914.1 hypothetical protein GCM10007894_08910 [Paraferrimonas haliotis]
MPQVITAAIVVIAVAILMYLLVLIWRLLPKAFTKPSIFTVFALLTVTPLLHVDHVGAVVLPISLFYFSPDTLITHLGNQLMAPFITASSVIGTAVMAWFMSNWAFSEDEQEQQEQQGDS